MSDYKRLKHLALAQPVPEWRSEEGEPSMMNGERMYHVIGPGGVSCWEHGAYNRVSASYIAAASPAVVLDLIAELDGYKQGAKVEADAADEARTEVRRLKAELEEAKAQSSDVWGLAQSRADTIDQLKAENERLRADYAALSTFNPDWDRVAAAQDSVREHMELASQLKAECEELRKHAPSSEIIWCECGDGYPANSYGAGFMAANDGVCENCDAANTCGSGEGSKADESQAQQGSACRSEQP